MTRPDGRHPFEYAVLRVVPRIERGEFINAGVVLYCKSLDFLGAKIHLDIDRLRALDPAADAESIAAALKAVIEECDQRAEPAQARDIGAQFRWLTAPRSTVVQPGPIHAGLTQDATAELTRLLLLLALPAIPSAEATDPVTS
jgi:Protein of unknown function (DUF3037)